MAANGSGIDMAVDAKSQAPGADGCANRCDGVLILSRMRWEFIVVDDSCNSGNTSRNLYGDSDGHLGYH